LTIFSCPKLFKGHIDIIQRNAIKSWARLKPNPEIILLGSDEGVGDICGELGLKHIPDIKCNEYGTPLVGDIFEKAEKNAMYKIMCYINADIILMDDFTQALKRLIAWKGRFLMVGQRWDLDLDIPIDYGRPDWRKDFKLHVNDNAVLHDYKGIDYIVFARGLFEKIPPFAIGRPYYDHWLIWKARSKGVPMVDATKVVTCVHQNHKRTYTSLGKEPLNGIDDLRKSKEADKNLESAGGDYVMGYSLLDSTHMMTPKMILPHLGKEYLKRRTGRAGESLKRRSPFFYGLLKKALFFRS